MKSSNTSLRAKEKKRDDELELAQGLAEAPITHAGDEGILAAIHARLKDFSALVNVYGPNNDDATFFSNHLQGEIFISGDLLFFFTSFY